VGSKIFTLLQTPFRGRPKFKSAGDGHFLYLQTQFGEDRCTQFRVIVVTDPQTHTHKPTDRTDYNTLHRSFANMQCNDNICLYLPDAELASESRRKGSDAVMPPPLQQ